MRSARWLMVGWLGMGALVSCQSLRGPETLDSGFYRIQRASEHDLPAQTLYIVGAPDTLQLYVPGTPQRLLLPAERYTSLTFYRREFDMDVFTIPFKIRAPQGGIPVQLNSNFNAALYVGRRTNFYRIDHRVITPQFSSRMVRTRGIGYGLFVGLGSATINEFVTQPTVGIEYEGLIVNGGLAAIYDARIFNVGVAVGLDRLFDRNRTNWLYQGKPWVGVLFGLNLN